jgi:folate-binding protein YgfZ
MTVHRDVKDTVVARLDQFIFSEDVQLGDVTDTFAQLAVVGPDAARIVQSLIAASEIEALPEHGNVRAVWNGQPAIVTRVRDTGVPGYDLFLDAAQRDALGQTLADLGIPALDEATADAIRIEAGVPVFGRDMDQDTIPLEAGIESRAISFSKGCYVGQEVIIRVLHRGHGRVARKLVGIVFDGARVPAPGATIRDGDRDIGHVTSSALSPGLERPIALGYVHRDSVTPGTAVTADTAPGIVSALPLVPTSR